MALLLESLLLLEMLLQLNTTTTEATTTAATTTAATTTRAASNPTDLIGLVGELSVEDKQNGELFRFSNGPRYSVDSDRLILYYDAKTL